MILRRSPDPLKPLQIDPLSRYRVSESRSVGCIEDEVLRLLLLRMSRRPFSAGSQFPVGSADSG